MRRFLNATVFALFAAVFSAAAENQSHLFVLSGQSNMAGLDPKISFIPAVENAFGANNVTVIKDAQGGQPIRRWYKNWRPAQGDPPKARGDLYDRLMKKVLPAVEEKQFDTITFLWMQGEKDAREGHGSVYAASMNGLLKQLAEDLGRDDVNFVIGRLSDFGLANATYPDWNAVRKAQMEVADSSQLGRWVSTDDLNDGVNRKGKVIKDDLHYSVEGYKEFGDRLAKTAIELIRANASE